MKRKIYTLGLAALMISIFGVLSASAASKRAAWAAPENAVESPELRQSQAKFLEFVGKLQSRNNSVTQSGSSTRDSKMRQLPEKIYRSAWDPVGKFYGCISQWQGMRTYDDAYFGEVFVNDGYSKPIYKGAHFTNRDEAYFQGGVVRDGILYTPAMQYDEDGMVTGEFNMVWRRFDLQAGKPLETLVFGRTEEAMLMFMYALTYDPINDIIYGLSYDNVSGAGGRLCQIDASQPEEQWRPIPMANVGGSNADWMAMLCFNPVDETLYGLKNTGVLCSIDKKGAVPVYEYDREVDYGCFPDAMQSTPACYSPYDKAIVFIGEDPGSKAFLSVAIDMDTYEAAPLKEFEPIQMMSALVCADPYGDSDGPDAVTDVKINLEGNDLNCTYSFTAPTKYFNGDSFNFNGTNPGMVMHILLDKEEIRTENVTPGETVNGNITLTQGQHNISIYCTIGEAKGPETKKRIYAGNDMPYPPTNLAYTNGILTWTRPIEDGVHNGYLDLSNVTYDVYLDNQKINDTPISDCSYAVSFADMATKRREIQVTATANEVSSQPSTSLSRVIGKGHELPAVFEPTPAEAAEFEKLNANKDAYEWSYTNSSREGRFWSVFTSEYTQKPDDWLFLPPVYLSSADDVYTFIVSYCNPSGNSLHKDNLDILIGKDPLPEAMTQLIYSHRAHIQTTPTDIKTRFSVKEPGAYYIAIHALPGDENYYRGVKVADFRIQKDNGSSLAPAEATDVKITPAPLGELSVKVEATLPTVAMNGTALSGDLTLTARSSAAHATVSGKPGEKVTTNLEVDTDGFSDIYLAVSNAAGEGNPSLYTVYTGIDSPLPPANVRGLISEDNLSVTVSWDAVGNVGEHGGYVDVDGVTYDFYSATSTSQNKIGSAGKDLSFTFRAGFGVQNQYFVGPVAVNQTGKSINGTFLMETLGSLYQTPMTEEWGISEFKYNKWVSNTAAPYGGVTWGHIISPLEDLGAHISFKEGAMRGEGAGPGELIAPRLTTKGVARVKASFRYWNYANAGHMELWGRTYDNQEFRKIAELEPSRPETGEWVDWEVALPAEFSDKAWIQLNVRTNLKPGQCVVLDNYNVLPDISLDLQLSALDAPYSVFTGNDAKFHVTVNNTGEEPIEGKLVLEILGDGDNLITKHEEDLGRLKPGDDDFEYNISLPINENTIIYEVVEVHAYVESDEDQNPNNNEIYKEFIVYDNTIPTVRDLKAEREGESSNVNLTWSAPDNSRKALESFEDIEPFKNTEEVGRWISADMDKMRPFVIENSDYRWPGDEEPCSWQVYSSLDKGTMAIDRLSPRSGNQMLMARSNSYDMNSEHPTRSLDFLISPEVKPGSKVTFWFNTADAQYSETVQIWYSTTDTNLLGTDLVLDDKENAPRECGSFKWFKNFTKSGAETWEECSFTLPSDAKYFAFVYASFGQYLAMIDDIMFEPVDPGKLTIDSYDVYVCYPGEEPSMIAREIKNTSFRHTNTDRAATYYVDTRVFDGDYGFSSGFSNPASVGVSGVNELEAGQFIGAGKGRILVGGAPGDEISIFDINGRVIRSATLDSDRKAFAVEAGVYVVRLGEKSVKVIVR